MGAPRKIGQTAEGMEACDPAAALKAPALPPHSPALQRAVSDGAQPVGRSANPASEEMREYHEQRSYILTRVGSTWMFGSGN